MKIKYIIFSILMLLSFYLTDKVMIYIDNKSPLMKEIVSKTDDYNVLPVNATISDNTIIPGINGKEINKHKSLIKMQEFGAFNENFLIYDTLKPNISLNDNKDKIIIKGNNLKRNISLILEPNETLENYLKDNNIEFTLIANLNTDLKLNKEYINGEGDEKKFSDLNALFNKNSLSKLCLVNYSNIEMCKKKDYYIVANSKDSNNYLNLIKNIESGDIILIKKNTSLDNLKLIINEIKRQDLSIVYLSKLISE